LLDQENLLDDNLPGRPVRSGTSRTAILRDIGAVPISFAEEICENLTGMNSKVLGSGGESGILVDYRVHKSGHGLWGRVGGEGVENEARQVIAELLSLIREAE
jgi:hypothetical protein